MELSGGNACVGRWLSRCRGMARRRTDSTRGALGAGWGGEGEALASSAGAAVTAVDAAAGAGAEAGPAAAGAGADAGEAAPRTPCVGEWEVVLLLRPMTGPGSPGRGE